jgi:hypothetical protein
LNKKGLRTLSPPVISACLDLGVGKPTQYREISKALAEKEIQFVVLMEDRQPDFFIKYDKYNAESYVRLNRHGPQNDTYYPTQNDLKSFVKAFRDEGIEILYGFWVHENRWVDERHQELLLTDFDGRSLRSESFVYDFNPLLKMKVDSDYRIRNGEAFAEYICKQYSNLADDFGFDGLFLGDGGMGFRLFGEDSIGLDRYDYGNSSIGRFATSQYYQYYHDHNCLLCQEEIGDRLTETLSAATTTSNQDNLTTADLSNDIWSYHQKGWIDWNCSEWSIFYKTISGYLHANRNDKLGAYSCMNYGPRQAPMHGIDYREIAASGLDYLVFQTYDYAWSIHFKLDNKDMDTNFQELVSLNEYLLESSLRSRLKILFTAETNDDIENWQCPPDRTLEETRMYSRTMTEENDESKKNFKEGKSGKSGINGDDNSSNNMPSRPITDGFFIVWMNNTPFDIISKIKDNFGAYLEKK